jgi:serine/threonine-protein kinase
MPERPEIAHARGGDAGRDRRRHDRCPGRLLPARLGPYELFDHVGRGGMADIYRARLHADLGGTREVVVKEVLPELARSERLAELLVREAKLAAQLDHPNVVRVEHLGREGETLYIAMEWVEGMDLRELLRRCARSKVSLPIDISVHIVAELCRGLDYAHEASVIGHDGEPRRGVVHRDVSPSNVLLSFDGEIKICDFGIARAFEATEPGTDEVVEGKAGYMSPEQARGERLDARADIFAAGIILWELLSGRKLYKAKDGEALLEVARRASVPALATRGLTNEAELLRIVGRALAPHREDRYASAGRMADDLEAWAARAEYVATARTVRRFLEASFAASILVAQRRRELATEALARGPVAVLTVLSVPVVGISSAIEAAGGGEAGEPASATAPARPAAGEPAWPRSAVALFVITAILVVYLVARAIADA